MPSSSQSVCSRYSLCYEMDGVKTISKRGRPSRKEIEQKIIEGVASGPQRSQFQCKECHRLFPRSKALKTHMSVHTGIKSHVCTYPGCKRASAQSGQLRTHSGIHTNEKQYKCQRCPKRFLHSNRTCCKNEEGKKLKLKKDGIIFVEIEDIDDKTPEQKEWIKNKKKEIMDKINKVLAKRRRASTSSSTETSSANTSIADPCSASTSTSDPSSKRKSRAGPRTPSTSRVGSFFASRKRRLSPCLDSTTSAGPYSASTKRRLSPSSENTSRPRPFSNLELMNGLNDNKENQPRNSVIVPNHNYKPHNNKSGIRSDLFPILSRRLSNLTLVNDAPHSDEPKPNNSPPQTEQLPWGYEDESKMEENVSSTGSERGSGHQDRNYANDGEYEAAVVMTSMLPQPLDFERRNFEF